MTDEFTAPEPGASKIIHLDVDAVVIGRNYRADVALVGDAKSTLQNLLDTIKKMAIRPKPDEKRLQEVFRKVSMYEDVINPMMNTDAIPIKPQRIMKEVMKVLKPRDIIVSDTGHMICWTTRFIKLKEAGINYIPCGGTLGSSFALAIGASFGAEKDQRVLNLIGDGGIVYNLAALETAKRYNDQRTPFVALVNNNSSLAQGRPRVEDWTKEEAPWINSCDLCDLNYAKIAEDFGCYGIRVERPNEIAEALENAFNSGKPAIVDVVSDKREYAPIYHRTNIKEYQKLYGNTPIY
jgi:acetolactate synthase-1/2/3 large subunit